MIDEPLSIPKPLREKVAMFPESSMGANLVTLDLVDGRKIHGVCIAWASEIVKVAQREIKSEKDLDFRVQDIIGIHSEI